MTMMMTTTKSHDNDNDDDDDYDEDDDDDGDDGDNYNNVDASMDAKFDDFAKRDGLTEQPKSLFLCKSVCFFLCFSL